MPCPICNSELYEKDRREITSGTFIAIRCSNPDCGYFDYRTIPINSFGTGTTIASWFKWLIALTLLQLLV